jgi:uroporphyrinogen-III decarboxylase
MEKLSSKERMLRTIAGQPVDRIPIIPPVPWQPLTPQPDPDNWKAQPNYQQLIPLVAENCDFYAHLDIPERSPIGNERNTEKIRGVATGGIFDRRFFFTHPERIRVIEDRRENGRRYTRFEVHTPKGDLTTIDVRPSDVDTVWTTEPLIKDVDDAGKILSAPHRFDPPDLTEYFAERDKLGNRGVAVCFVTSPLVMISRMMDFEQMFEWTLTERPLFEKMLQTAQERIAERLQWALENGVGPIFRFGGCEQATPPMMSNHFFDEIIIRYEGPLWRMVRDAGRILWVHCHGKVSTIFDRFVDMGVQLLDPVEPPPQGDIQMKEAKERAAAGPMTLIGNIEISDLQAESADQIESKVREAICQGGRKHFILGPSDVACSAVEDHLRDNIIRFVEAGVKYGTFNADDPCAQPESA